MAQDDYVLPDDTAAAVRAKLNSALAAVATLNSGATAPATTYASMWWFDTAGNVLYQRDEANAAWVAVAAKSGASWVPYRNGVPLGDAAVATLGTEDGDVPTAELVGLLARVGSWSRAQVFAPLALDASTSGDVDWDLDVAQVATLALDSNLTLAPPTHLRAGAFAYLFVVQGGGFALSFGSGYNFAGASSPTISTQAGGVDVLMFVATASELLFLGTRTGFVVPGGGGGPTFGPTRSLFLGLGSGDYLANFTTDLPLGFTNTWTLSLWSKLPLTTGLGTSYVLNVGDNPGSSSQSRIDVAIVDTGTPATSFLAVLLFDDTGTLFKNYRWTNAVADDTWQHWLVTWDGTTLAVDFDGASVSPTSTPVDNAGTMDDPARDVSFGVAIDGSSSPMNDGHLGHAAIWDSVLSAAEAAAIFAGGFAMDLTANSGAYVSSANLIHYWRPFFADANFNDEVGATGLLDSTADVGDMVTDAP